MLENQLNQCFMVIFSFFIVRRSGNPGYKAGNVIAIEEAYSCLVLGDKGQGLIVVDLEGNVGRVAIRYDESKGASIEKNMHK